MSEQVSVSDSACVVEFVAVGRDKKSWIAELPLLDHPHMLRSVHARSALRSRDVDFTYSAALPGGEILAWSHPVGSWRMLSGRSPETRTLDDDE